MQRRNSNVFFFSYRNNFVNDQDERGYSRAMQKSEGGFFLCIVLNWLSMWKIYFLECTKKFQIELTL